MFSMHSIIIRQAKKVENMIIIKTKSVNKNKLQNDSLQN